mgnify:CR=1 FL=1
MKLYPRLRQLIFVLGLQLLLTKAFSAEHVSGVTAGIKSTVGDSTQWTAANWSNDDVALFEGIPVELRVEAAEWRRAHIR